MGIDQEEFFESHHQNHNNNNNDTRGLTFSHNAARNSAANTRVEDEVTDAAKALISFSHVVNRNTITKRKKNTFREGENTSSDMKLKQNVNHLASTLVNDENSQQQTEMPKILMKDLNKEERLRLVREKREQEIAKRKKEIEENLKRKEELRERQLQDRKRRMDELKLKENSKHLAVGERRKKREELARVRYLKKFKSLLYVKLKGSISFKGK